jgi:hypothetical protein
MMQDDFSVFDDYNQMGQGNYPENEFEKKRGS